MQSRKWEQKNTPANNSDQKPGFPKQGRIEIDTTHSVSAEAGADADKLHSILTQLAGTLAGRSKTGIVRLYLAQIKELRVGGYSFDAISRGMQSGGIDITSETLGVLFRRLTDAKKKIEKKGQRTLAELCPATPLPRAPPERSPDANSSGDVTIQSPLDVGRVMRDQTDLSEYFSGR